MTTVYLIRHAEADGNVYRRIHGQYDGLVTPRGYRQIQCLSHRFRDIKTDAVYSSDLFRTYETARAISEPKGLNLITLPNLREIAFGPWEDITWGEALVNHTQDYMIWEKSPHMFRIDGSETYEQIYARARFELDRIVRGNRGKTVAIVTHGTVIRALLCMLSLKSMERVSEIAWCENTGVAKLVCDDNGDFTIVYCNDATHIKHLATVGNQRWWQENFDPGLSNLHFVRAHFPDDLDKVDSYYRASWSSLFDPRTYNSSYVRSRLKKAYSANPDSIVFARQGSGNEIGITVLDTKAQLLPNSGHIMLLYLDDCHRGNGYGAQLLGHAVSIYRSLGRHWVTVRASSLNTRALKFYEKFGFEEFGMEQSDNSLQYLLRKCIAPIPHEINWK